jgi:hypothetical protein
MNRRLAAIALAACVCGLLLASPASAQRSADHITVNAAVLGPTTNGGTYVEFTAANGGSPLKQVSFSGGSDFHFSSMTSFEYPACKLTPSDGGVTCSFTSSDPENLNFYFDTFISGTLPTTVNGTVVYADNSTGTFTAPVTNGPPGPYEFPHIRVDVTGTNIQISVLPLALPAISQFSFVGGSDWHVTAISSGGGNCTVTTDGGGSCDFTTAVYSFVLNATLSGTPPTSLRGRYTTYGGFITQRWGWDYHVLCHCAKTSAELVGFKTEHRSAKLSFILKWKVDCHVGDVGACGGAVAIRYRPLPVGLRLQQANGKPWHGGLLHLLCQPKKGVSCPPTITGEKELVLVGQAAARERETVRFQLRLRCGGFGLSGTHTREDLTLTFDKHGNLKSETSHLGKIVDRAVRARRTRSRKEEPR